MYVQPLISCHIHSVDDHIIYNDEEGKSSLFFILKLKIIDPKRNNIKLKSYYVKPWDIDTKTMNSPLFRKYLTDHNVSSWAQLIDDALPKDTNDNNRIASETKTSNNSSKNKTGSDCPKKNRKRKFSEIDDDDERECDTTNNSPHQTQRKRRRNDTPSLSSTSKTQQHQNMVRKNNILNCNIDNSIVSVIRSTMNLPQFIPQTTDNVNVAKKETKNKPIVTKLRYI